METKHDVPQSSIIGVKPGVNLGLVLGGFGGIRDRFGMGSFRICFGDGGCGFVIRSGELVCDNLSLALGEKVVHHQRPPGLPVHGAVQDRDEGHESGGHCWFLYNEGSAYVRAKHDDRKLSNAREIPLTVAANSPLDNGV